VYGGAGPRGTTRFREIDRLDHRVRVGVDLVGDVPDDGFQGRVDEGLDIRVAQLRFLDRVELAETEARLVLIPADGELGPPTGAS
jgi:hypothetical protein